MHGRPLSLRAEWADALRDGRKTIDACLVADDIAGLEVGTVVRYPGASLRIKRIRFYPGFGDLLAHEDWRRIAPDAADPGEVQRRVEEEHEATVHATRAVAIELEPIDPIAWRVPYDFIPHPGGGPPRGGHRGKEEE